LDQPFLAFFPSTTNEPVPLEWWIIPAALSALGYAITIVAAKIHERRTLKTYVRMDYERTQYYEQYLRKSEEILDSLYSDIDSIHIHSQKNLSVNWRQHCIIYVAKSKRKLYNRKW
jgi:hypothetical protein